VAYLLQFVALFPQLQIGFLYHILCIQGIAHHAEGCSVHQGMQWKKPLFEFLGIHQS
jgi:hypothetical protein